MTSPFFQAKGIVALNGAALADLFGELSLTIGIGLEYLKETKTILPYIKGSTGLALGLSIDAVADFVATIGPFSADVNVDFVSVDGSVPFILCNDNFCCHFVAQRILSASHCLPFIRLLTTTVHHY